MTTVTKGSDLTDAVELKSYHLELLNAVNAEAKSRSSQNQLKARSAPMSDSLDVSFSSLQIDTRSETDAK